MGIFYIPTLPYTEGRILEVHKIHLLCGAFEGNQLLRYALSIVSEEMIPFKRREEFRKSTYTHQNNYGGISEFKRLLNYYIDYAHRSETIDAIARKFGFDFEVSDFYVTADQIVEMASSNMVIGSHKAAIP